MKKLNNKGLAPVLIVVITLAVVAVGLAGYRVYQNSKDKPITKENQTAQNEASKAEVKEENDGGNQQTSEKQYLEIKEYGVKIVLSEDIKDAYYVIDNSYPYPYLSVHSLDKYSDCNLTKGTGYAFAAVSKAKVGDDHFGSPWTQEDLESTNSIKIGEYYYWIEPGNGGSCSDPSGEKPDIMESKAKHAFTSAKLEKL